MGARANHVLAVAIAALPFVLRGPVIEWCGCSEADAQLGFFLTATAFAWTTFRTIELVVGTVPDGANASMSEWIAYVGSDLDPRYEGGRPIVPPPGRLAAQVPRQPGRVWDQEVDLGRAPARGRRGAANESSSRT